MMHFYFIYIDRVERNETLHQFQLVFFVHATVHVLGALVYVPLYAMLYSM